MATDIGHCFGNDANVDTGFWKYETIAQCENRTNSWNDGLRIDQHFDRYADRFSRVIQFEFGDLQIAIEFIELDPRITPLGIAAVAFKGLGGSLICPR